MPPKVSQPSSTKATTAESARMQLAKAVADIAKNQSSFQQAVEAYKNITDESVAALQRQIDVRQAEYNEACETQDQDLKKRKVEFDLDLQAHKRQCVVRFLDEIGEEPITKTEHAALLAANNNAADQKAAELEVLEKRLKSDHHAALSAALKQQGLEHKAAVAQLEAQSGQAAKEVGSLKETISELREEIREQRKLTQSVAEASKQGAIQQTFGGKG